MIDAVTQSWIRNISDQKAADAGCRFNWEKGARAVWWMERYCRLYEGNDYAGSPLILWGCLDCDYSDYYASTEDFWLDDEEEEPKEKGPAYFIHEERAACHAECVRKGHRIDWQYEFAMRCHGWQMFREKWDRYLRRFRRGSVWLPKKQKKSPTLAAESLYMFAGDKEQGQHVYLLAKDGAQSKKIAGEHAFQMVDQSPELKGAFKPNLNEKSLYFHETRSKWEPLSSSNARTQQSKEGLNGSGFVDEAHVVDGAFIRRTDRMGISRREPLFLSFSTAGNNPDGWGHSEFQYAEKILDGRTTNHEYLAMIYAAPQDVTDQDLDREFDKYARMANPSMGHTIDPDEIRNDYERSKETIEKLADFKMYRLNVWQHSSNPWIRPSDWAKCGQVYTEQDLLGLTCFAGLDLSLRWDITAIALCFPWGDSDPPRFRYWWYLFIPEEGARKLQDKVPIRSWEKEGFIKITDGNTTDFPLIRRYLQECRDKFDLVNVAYDERFAQTLMQQAQDEDGLTVHPFKQSPGEFAEPMGLFESDVIEGRLEHANNPCVSWMAGNATKGKNGLLMKPEQGDTKKIDAVTAAVQARAMANEKKDNDFWNPAIPAYL